MNTLNGYESFIHETWIKLESLGIARDELAMMDHICYRVETEERYQELLLALQEEAMLVGENEVSGRQVATFELNKYLHVDDWTVPYLELPAPKEGSPYEEGLEHVELVVIGSLERFLKRHSDLSFSSRGLDKVINPELSLNNDDISVKFHEQQLGAVVGVENRLMNKAV